MGMNVKEKSDVMGKDEAMLTNMLLHSGYIETVLLMKTTSPLSMVLCCTMVFVLGIIQEGLHFPRQWILPCFRYPHYRRVDDQESEVEVKTISMFSWEHLALTLVYLVQVILSYSSMMVFMTLNIWLCLAVVLGHTGGFLLFRQTNYQITGGHC